MNSVVDKLQAIGKSLLSVPFADLALERGFDTGRPWAAVNPPGELPCAYARGATGVWGERRRAHNVHIRC